MTRWCHQVRSYNARLEPGEGVGKRYGPIVVGQRQIKTFPPPLAISVPGVRAPHSTASRVGNRGQIKELYAALEVAGLSPGL